MKIPAESLFTIGSSFLTAEKTSGDEYNIKFFTEEEESADGIETADSFTHTEEEASEINQDNEAAIYALIAESKSDILSDIQSLQQEDILPRLLKLNIDAAGLKTLEKIIKLVKIGQMQPMLEKALNGKLSDSDINSISYFYDEKFSMNIAQSIYDDVHAKNLGVLPSTGKDIEKHIYEINKDNVSSVIEKYKESCGGGSLKVFLKV